MLDTKSITMDVSEKVYDFLTTYSSTDTAEQTASFLFEDHIESLIGNKTQYIPKVRVDVLEKLYEIEAIASLNADEDGQITPKLLKSAILDIIGDNADPRVIQKYTQHFKDFVTCKTGFAPKAMSSINIEGFKDIIAEAITEKKA